VREKNGRIEEFSFLWDGLGSECEKNFYADECRRQYEMQV
jgi:hypothetical protein